MYSDPVSDEPSIESTPSVVWKSGSVSVLHLLQRYDCYCECSQADNWHTIERTKRPVYPRGYMVHGTCRLLPHDEPFFSITNTHSANWDPWFMETFCHRKGNHLPASDSFERSYQDANRARLTTLFLGGTGASPSNNGFGNVGVAVAGVMGHSFSREGGPGAPAAASRVLTRGSAALSERSAAALAAAASVGAAPAAISPRLSPHSPASLGMESYFSGGVPRAAPGWAVPETSGMSENALQAKASASGPPPLPSGMQLPPALGSDSREHGGAEVPPRRSVDHGVVHTPQLEDTETKLAEMELLEVPQRNLVPVAFNWHHGAVAGVEVAGSFDGWKRRHPLHRSGNAFYILLNLEPGDYQYKYVVDGEWRYAPEQMVARDAHGNVNNFIRVEPFFGEFLVQDDFLPGTKRASEVFRREQSPVDSYDNAIPGIESGFHREPPPLPVLLGEETAPRLPIEMTPNEFIEEQLRRERGEVDLFPPRPVTVTLNHLYIVPSGVSANVRHVHKYVLTRRYHERYVTSVFYLRSDRIPSQSWERSPS
jgi:5'-AMP-activated protein kinase regulatory beta subunit